METGGVVVLMYHAIVVSRPDLAALAREDRPYAVSLKLFEDHMRLLPELGITAITPDRLVGYLQGSEKLPEKAAVVTFDDGFRNFFTHAYPVLKSLGIPAGIFVRADSIGQPNYLTWPELAELVGNGFTIGSHSWSHRLFSDLPEHEVSRELELSKRSIESKLWIKVQYLSLPGGRRHEALQKIAGSLGYRAIFTSRPGLNRAGDTCWAIKRVPVKETITPDDLKNLFSQDRTALKHKEMAYLFKEKLKVVAGDRMYALIYNIFSRTKTDLD